MRVIAAVVGLGGCGTSDPTAATTQDSGIDSSSSTDAGADAIVPPAGCDAAADPKDAPACVVDGFGVFVDATGGNDANAGTKASPVKTITAAIGKVGNKPRVYICEGTYPESIVLTSAVSLYGGFSCGGFIYTGTKAKVQPASGTVPALDLSGSNLTIADLALVGPDIGAPSSIAARAVSAKAVVFLRTSLEARMGAGGATGTRTDFTGFPAQADLNGSDAVGAVGGLAKEATCPGGLKTRGGKGGYNGFSGDPGVPSLGGGAGGILGQSCAGIGTGGDGAVGLNSAGGGATKAGSLVLNAWTPEPGASGQAGGPGQGGGGGQGVAGGGGGGGGAGGCGGAGGGGGNGGGGSIALLAIESDLVFRASGLTAGVGGAGGAGFAGQQGQQIFGFGGNKSGGGCGGGNGAKGGAGGAGGGGSGGFSVGILYKGTQPTLEATTIATGTPGLKGLGGTPGVNDGIDGQKADIVQAP